MGNLIALPGPETVQHIFFPGLGLEFDLNRVAVILLGRPIYWYGIILAAAMLVGLLLKHGGKTEALLGACHEGEDPNFSAALATLDAVNRRLPTLPRRECSGVPAP